MTTPRHLQRSANSDDGAITLEIASDVYHHQLSVDTSAESGTFTVEARAPGASNYTTVSGEIDLSDASKLTVLWEGFYSHLQITPVDVASDTDYTLTYVGGNG